MYLPQEIQIRIIKQATLLELVEHIRYKNKKRLLFSLLINSHCCCCGKVLPIFYSKHYGYSKQYFDSNGHYDGKYCSKSCFNRLLDYWDIDFGGVDIYPPYHQVLSGRDGAGFFEMLNERYKDIWSEKERLRNWNWI